MAKITVSVRIEEELQLRVKGAAPGRKMTLEAAYDEALREWVKDRGEGIPEERFPIVSIEAESRSTSPRSMLVQIIDEWFDGISSRSTRGDKSGDGTRTVPGLETVSGPERKSRNIDTKATTSVASESLWINKLIAVLRSGHQVATVAIQKNLEAFELLAVGGEFAAGDAGSGGGPGSTPRVADVARRAQRDSQDTKANTRNPRADQADAGGNRKRVG